MKYLTLKTSVLAVALLGSANVAATDVNAGISFTTLPAISISPIRALSFGNSLYLTNGSVCQMAFDTGTEVMTAAQVGTTEGAVATYFDNVGALTGSCDTAVNGVAGIYEITSVADARISVTVEPGTATELSFTPAGHAVNFAGATDAALALASGVAGTIEASGASDAGTVAGKNRVIVVGSISNTQALTAGQNYATDFQINVVYN